MDINQALTMLANQGPASFLLGIAVWYFYQEIQKLKKENIELREKIMTNEINRNEILTNVIEANSAMIKNFAEIVEKHFEGEKQS